MEFIIAATLLAILAQSYRIVDLLDEIREGADRGWECENERKERKTDSG